MIISFHYMDVCYLDKTGKVCRTVVDTRFIIFYVITSNLIFKIAIVQN